MRMPDATRTPAGGGRFDITVAGDTVTKRGDPRALAREAAGLRRAAGLDLAPRLLRAGRGVVVSARIDGAERRLDTLRRTDAQALGQALRRLHEGRRCATGGLPHWPSRARSLTSYRRRRADDTLAAAERHRELAERILAGLPAIDEHRAAQPFRLVHGDLVASNILWTPTPHLIDFEFWRMGDPAEDLAYLVEVNALPHEAVTALLEGYANASVAYRVDAWRALCALDAGLWYRNAGQPHRAAELVARACRRANL